MHNRISGPSTFLNHAHELAPSMDSDRFRQTLAGMSSRSVPDPHATLSSAPTRPYSLVSQPPVMEFERLPFGRNRQNLTSRRRLPPGELPDKMGCCVSTPQAMDPHDPGSSSTARPITPLFDYRTAELHEANVDGICVGLTAEWFRNLHNSPSTRMSALAPGSQTHYSAAERQEEYQDGKDQLRLEGLGESQADLEAQNSMFRRAGLKPSGKEKVYQFGEHSSVSRMLGKITNDGSEYLLTLYFAEGGSHTVATAAQGGRTTLFDPNYGEFTVQSEEMEDLFQSLANRYRDPNGRHLSSITTQKME